MTLSYITHYAFKQHTLPEGCREKVSMTKVMNEFLLNETQIKNIRKISWLKHMTADFEGTKAKVMENSE